MSFSKAPLAVIACLVSGFFLPLLGCGHPATESECQLIVDKNVELQIKAMSAPPADVEKEKARVRTEMDPLLKGCVGRITNRMLTCVRGATTVKEVDQCTR